MCTRVCAWLQGANLLLEKTGVLKVADFGMAKQIHEQVGLMGACRQAGRQAGLLAGLSMRVCLCMCACVHMHACTGLRCGLAGWLARA